MFTTLISVDDLQALSRANVVLLDCRHDLAKPDWGREAYHQSHIAGAHYASLDTDLSAAKTGKNGRHPLPSRADFAAWLAKRGVTAQTQVVCYDQLDAMFAARAWWMLRWAGFSKVAVLQGGFTAWQAAGGARNSVVPALIDGPALDLPPLETVINMAQLQAPHHFTLLDARAPERYRGEVEPLDAKAGHMPGAKNHFFKTNVNGEGRFANPVVLAANFLQSTGGAAAENLVHTCGSGATACHNILAMRVAGLYAPQQAAKLYAGSWSEWSAWGENSVETI